MMTVSRRELGWTMLGGATAILLPSIAYATNVKPMPEGVELPTLDQEWPPGTPDLGSEPPLPIEREIGDEILRRAPLRTTPLGVAQYFDRIGRGVTKTADFPGLAQRPDLPPGDQTQLIRYVGEWSEKYNPVILSFFINATGTKPEGDCTPWCSAFVNWCLKRSREGYPKLAELEANGNPGARTRSAASQSFRTWGYETTTPSDGDIIVFQNNGDPQHGHVGFYRVMNDNDRAWAKEKKVRLDDFVKVLGGNQGRRRDIDQLASSCRDAKYYGGSVTITYFPRDARRYTFRTHPSLHSLWA